MWDILGIMAALCLGAAAVLSLIIRSWAQGVAIMTCFTVPAIIGLLFVGGRTGMLLFFGAGAGVFGCAAAIGAFRFWPTGSPVARASVSVAILLALGLILGLAAYVAIPA